MVLPPDAEDPDRRDGWGPPKRPAPAAPPGGVRASAPPPPPVVTVAIIALNVLVMGAMVATGISATSPDGASLVAWGSNFGPYTLSGEPWRLLTSAFLHGGLIHLGMNMYVLWGAGQTVERFYGRAAYVELYLLAAVAGSAASVLWNPGVHSVGASGAVFGVVGAFAAYLFRNRTRIAPEPRRRLLRSLGFFVVINLAIGFVIPIIDQAAHVGGLLAGALGGLVTAPELTRDPRPAPVAWWRQAILVGLAVAIVGAVGVVGAFAAAAQIQP